MASFLSFIVPTFFVQVIDDLSQYGVFLPFYRLSLWLF